MAALSNAEPPVGHCIAATSSRQAFLALTAGFLGWTLGAFDFFLVVISLPRIAADFQVGQVAP
jgi:hypothetical protein